MGIVVAGDVRTQVKQFILRAGLPCVKISPPQVLGTQKIALVIVHFDIN